MLFEQLHQREGIELNGKLLSFNSKNNHTLLLKSRQKNYELNIIISLMSYNSHSQYIQEDTGSNQFPNIYINRDQKYHKLKSSKPICFNISDTQYDVIQRVGQEMGWKLQYNDNKNWDLKWNDSAITADFLAKLASHQKINHFPGMNTLHRKNNLAKNLYRMYDEDPDSYDFFPRTFLLPYDNLRLRHYYQQTRKKGILKTFIVKPEASCQGRGIFLTQDIDEIFQYEHCVVQKYVSNPLLYKGLKFDFRVYALVAGCDPLRIYIYNEGLVRFSTQKYEYPCQQNMDDLCMHLTNYAINKDNPKYVFNESLQNLSYGHKKSLAQFFQTLKSLGYKAHQYWSDIKDVIIKTMISGQPHLQHEYRMAQPNNLANNMCFQILGFDFMIDAQGKVYLLQINHTPSFTTDTPLDELIKSNLIRDTVILMNVTPEARDYTIAQSKEIHQRRVFTGKTVKLTNQQRIARVEQIQQIRQEYEKKNLGSFERIFPSKNKAKQQKYLQLLQLSLNSYKQLSSGTKPKKSPTKFRISKRLATNQSYGQGQDVRQKQQEKNSNKHHNNRSQSVKQQQNQVYRTYNIENMQGSPITALLSKKVGLKTSNQEATMFSRKLQSHRDRDLQRIPINIHV